MAAKKKAIHGLDAPGLGVEDRPDQARRALHVSGRIERGVAHLGVSLDEDGYDFLANYANGDARAALNLLSNALDASH